MKYLLLFLSLIFLACEPTTSNETESSNENPLKSSNENPLAGLAGGSCSHITFSKDTVYFGKQGGVDTILINGVSIPRNDNKECKFIKTDHYAIGDLVDGKYMVVEVTSDYCKNNYCFPYSSDIIYGSSNNAPVVKIECPWYSLAHISRTSVQVTVNKNETGKERNQFIKFFGGNCFGFGIRIIQYAEHK